MLQKHPWRFSTFQGARDHVLLLGLETTFREKLEWLEEAETLSLRFAANGQSENAKKLTRYEAEADTAKNVKL